MTTILPDLAAELAALRAENARLKTDALKIGTLKLKVSEKGAVSIYGMGRFPVTLYKSQWKRLEGFMPSVMAFISDNDGRLKEKGD